MSPSHGWKCWLFAICLFSGCATLQDAHYEHTQRFRSETAFASFLLGNKCLYPLDYAKGWKAGYYDVITGGCGQPPLFAPHPYWHPFQILCHCDENRVQWYQGFQDGAAVAMTEPDTHYLRLWNVPNYCQLPAVTPAPAPYYESESSMQEFQGIPQEPPPVQSSSGAENAPAPEATPQSENSQN